MDFLERAGFRTLEAANADEAMVHMNNNDINVLFTDIDMLGSMDGLGLVSTVRSRWPATPEPLSIDEIQSALTEVDRRCS